MYNKGIVLRGVLCVSSASAGSAYAGFCWPFDQLLPSCRFGSAPCVAVSRRQLLHLFASKKDTVGQSLDDLICVMVYFFKKTFSLCSVLASNNKKGNSKMKALTITRTQYASESLKWSYLHNCDATDFIFIPPDLPTNSEYTSAAAAADASEMAAAIRTLIDGRNDSVTNIYIGTPGITSGNYGRNPAYTQLTSFLSSVYNNLTTAHKQKVAGAYMNQEAIYGGVDYTNLTGGSQAGNVQIRRMMDVKSWVKSGNIRGRTFLWIPYYGYGANAAAIIKNIGYVSDSVQIFDYVLLQPHVLFEPSTTNGNFAGITASMSANQICYRNGVNAVAAKTSSTQIGFEMEYGLYRETAEALYNQYAPAFFDYKSYPQAFSWASFGDSTTFGKINDWY